jgi:hypothetical protein
MHQAKSKKRINCLQHSHVVFSEAFKVHAGAKFTFKYSKSAIRLSWSEICLSHDSFKDLSRTLGGVV